MAFKGEKNNTELYQGLFGVLSHELKSPINSIESLLKVITDGFTGEVNQKTMHLIRRALAKTEETRSLISDLLNFEKYSTAAIEQQETDFIFLLTPLFHRLKHAASLKNISLSFQSPPSTKIIIQGDRTGLELAFSNLFDNAVKYTAEDGRVTILVSLDTEKKSVTVNISDTGAGIAPEDLDHLFIPFFRAPAVRAKIAGTGLGLSIAKQVIEKHAGTITLSSELGKGTTFSVRLPFMKLDHAVEKQKKRIVIIGGVTAGPKAAARLRRLDEECDITIIEKSEFLSYAGCGIPSYLSGKVTSPKALMSTADSTLRDVHFFEHIKDIKILNKTLAEHINRRKKAVIIRDLTTDTVSALAYDILILSTGAQTMLPEIPGIEGESVHSLYKIEDAERIKQIFDTRPATDVIIIGGGLIGVETAESLMATGARVTILEKDPHILKLFDPDIADKIQEILSLKGIKTLTNIGVKEIIHENASCRIVTSQGDFVCDLIILSTGVKPNACLGEKAGLAIGANGGIVVDEYLKTSDPSIYAIGDCAETKNIISNKRTYLPLGSISTKMGRIAADNIAGKKVKFKGGIGTTMFKIFDIAVGRTGLGFEEAQNEGFDVVSVVISGLDHTHYYKGADDIVLKVIADRKSKRLLGAQGYGRGEIISRIEILAASITARMTLADIFALDLGYFPAFNNPIDILQAACSVLENKIEGIFNTITLQEFLSSKGKYNVIDVSPVADFTFHSIPGSINIPLENLRGSSLPFDKDAPIILCSKTSSRAYEAFRSLVAQGYRGLSVLEGGYIYYKKG